MLPILVFAPKKLRITYRILRSFCPREFRPREDFSLWNEMTSWKNPIELEKFSEMAKIWMSERSEVNRKTPVKRPERM